MEKTNVVQRIKVDALMLMIAFIWGSAFTAQQMAARSLGTFAIIGIRFLGAGLLLLVLFRFRIQLSMTAIWQSVGIGVLLFSASALQQVALLVSTVGNAGFITGMYVVFIPVFLSLFWRRRIWWNAWAAVLLVLMGLYLLTSSGNSQITRGDVFLIGSSILYAFQMIALSHVVRRSDPYQVAVVQFLACGILGMGASLFFEQNTLAGIQQAWQPMLFLTVLATGVAFTLQGVAQKIAEPTDAAIFLSMESVFAALVGVVYLQETFTPWQLAGCGLMFAAMVLSQIEFQRKKAMVSGMFTPIEIIE
jgi:drug/metabolite transporter (DMT)-like permease